jgi:hypothetical protein|nr:DUF6056 family protein [Ruminococcus bromii]
MQTKLDTKKIITIVAIFLGTGLLLSLIPIIISSFYSHPLADDFGFSEKVNHVVKNGGGLFDILSASFQQVKDTYLDWQGTYAAIFVFSLQPAAFSEHIYFLTTFVMLTALIASTLFFVNTIFNILGYDKKIGIIISFVILLLSIHFVVDKKEAFFWWNGSSYYTLFYSFSLLFFSILIKLYYAEKIIKKVIFLIISLLLAAILGGGNYSTALLTTVILAFAIFLLIKHKKKISLCYVMIFLILITGFVISMIAPGNSVRAAAITGESPVKAIIHSVFYAVVYIAKWTGLAQLAGFSVIGFFAYILTKNSKYKFQYPFIVFVLSVLVFATQLTPPLYAMSSVGSGRQINIYYYSYYILMSFNIFYIIGWINQKDIVRIRAKNIQKSFSVCTLLLIIGVFLCGCLNYGLHNITFVDTLLALKNSTPQTYSAEYLDRISQIKNGNTTISDIKTVPDFFSPLCIEEDSDFWINKQIARYYDVDKVTLKTE